MFLLLVCAIQFDTNCWKNINNGEQKNNNSKKKDLKEVLSK
jgi:hypothetical protein